MPAMALVSMPRNLPPQFQIDSKRHIALEANHLLQMLLECPLEVIQEVLEPPCKPVLRYEMPVIETVLTVKTTPSQALTARHPLVGAQEEGVLASWSPCHRHRNQ